MADQPERDEPPGDNAVDQADQAQRERGDSAADQAERDAPGDNAVALARRKEWAALVRLLAAGAADVDASDDAGRRAFHYSAGYGELAACEALLRAGADCNARDRAGMTPLHWACLKGHADVVGVLLRLGGADAFATAERGVFAGKTAIDLVASQEGERAAAVREVLLQQMGASLFQLRKVVGRGGYGVVVKATRRDSGQVLALKAVRKQTSGDAAPPSPAASSREVSAALKERTALAGLQHPFVVSLHCAFQTKQHLYLALDFCAGGDLAMYVRHAGKGGLPEPTAQFVSAEVLLALEYLHGEGVIHRDVKAENVLVDEQGHVRLADMNVAKRHGAGDDAPRTFTLVGTPFSTAPEVLRGGGHSFACDWWSFGVLLFEVCAGRPPFPADLKLLHAQARVVHEILHGLPAAPPATASVELVNLLDALLVRDESRRMASAEALRATPFYAGVRWAALLAKQLRSPLLPADVDGVSVFRYPSYMMGQRSILAPAAAAPAAAADDGADAEEVAAAALRATLKRGEEAGASPAPAPAPGHRRAPSLTDPLLSGVAAAEIQGWDFVAETTGARLWARARSRVSQLARLHGMSRMELLVFTILTVAAHRATGVTERRTELDEPSPVRRSASRASTPVGTPPASRGASFLT